MDDEFDGFYPPRDVSYLQARDPSIVGWNKPGIEKVRTNLADEFGRDSSVPFKSQDEGLGVHLRMKGGVPINSLYRIEGNTLLCPVPARYLAASNRKEKIDVVKKYIFSSIFGPEAKQEDIFNNIMKEKVLNFINGSNSTLLTYGASGSGKTFTMMGTAEQPGIIPRSLDYLFRTISISGSREPEAKPHPNGKIDILGPNERRQELQYLRGILEGPQACSERSLHAKTYDEMQRRLSSNQVGSVNALPIVCVWVSFAEIYNEDIYDLLQPLHGRGQQRPKLKIGGLQDDTYIKGLKYVYVRSGLEAYQVLQYGLHNLSYAATGVNQHSSRSHCIFTVRLVAGYDEKKYSVSLFNFCDLAGSERLKKTLNVGDRLKESLKINASLSVLGRCISSIRDMQQKAKDSCNAPFRESKLTQLFQKALQGKEDIFMIVNINPSPDMFDDTQHALIFSAVAKQIITQDEQSILPLSLDEQEDERDQELRELRNKYASLVLQNSEQKEYIENLEMAFEKEMVHIRSNYDNIIELRTKQVFDLREEVEQLTSKVEQLEKELRKLRNGRYSGESSKMARMEQPNESVIVLSSSDASESEADISGYNPQLSSDSVDSLDNWLET